MVNPDKPKVYYRSARSVSPQTSLVADVLTLFDAAGFADMIKPHDMVAIKMHCGEWNNTGYLRPVYARALVDRIKALGGRPFVCDTQTLPYNSFASRSSAVDLLTTAERNGFTPATLGCPFLAADGYSGRDDVRVELPEGFILKEAYVASAIAMADVLITLSHFKGHGIGMIGGAIKNLGIGAQSKRGKHNVHLGGHPKYGLGAATDFHPERCLGRRECPVWEACQDSCSWGLFEVTEDGIKWDREKCTGCLAHLGANTWCGVMDCPEETWQATNAAIADACLATVKAVGRDKVGFINLAIDVTPGCDCVPWSDMPLVPNIGVMASTDPVAIDTCAKDMVTAAHGTPGSAAEDCHVMEPGMQKMAHTAGGARRMVSEEIQLETGALIGLGSRDYELVELEAPPSRMPFVFSPDPRPVGQRFRRLQRSPLGSFPYDLHDGRGFVRRDEVDLSQVLGKPMGEIMRLPADQPIEGGEE